MASTFKPVPGSKYDAGITVNRFTVDPAATFKLGELVYWDTSSHTLKGCGADPSLILGQALASAAFGLGTEWPGNIFGGTKIPVACFGEGCEVFMSSTSTPSDSDLLVDYGIASVGGTWQVDTSDTTNKRVTVLRVFNALEQEGYVVRFDPKYLQAAGVQA